MSSISRRNPNPENQSLFFHDLASPISVNLSGKRFNSPKQLSSQFHNNFGGSEPPPPPIFTLDDRIDFSPEQTLGEFPISPEQNSDSRNPKNSPYSRNPVKNFEVENEEKGRGSPIDGIVQDGDLITLPPLREVVRPEIKRNDLSIGALEEEEWVTVYGFSPGDTNLVLREFEKCGTILKHVPGPRDANWMHILYQNHYDAQRALGKNGAQINKVLIIGVKPVDYAQRQYLDERLNTSNSVSFLTPSFTPRTTFGRSAGSSVAPSAIGTATRSNVLNGGGSAAASGKGHRSTGAIASPAKSVMSKVMDLMFGI